MIEYRAFIETLEVGLKRFLSSPEESWKEQALKYVNGYAEDELRRLVALERRREYGAFFTNHTLAKKVLSASKFKFGKKVVIYDPACGAGNLLLSVADVFEKMLTKQGSEITLFGTDLHKEFVDAARLRLAINQLINERGALQYEVNLSISNGLLNNSFYKTATHIVTNPPFNLIESGNEIKWCNGKVSAAAVFIDKMIEYVNPGTSFIAILPDVLRSGSRYEKWREIIDRKCLIKDIKLLGQFDKYADVDVFSLSLVKRKKEKKKNSKNLWTRTIKSDFIIEDLFDVCVGPVVDNRDPYKGENLDYIVSKGLKGWTEVTSVKLKRKHPGKKFESPFVVIKRTSRMGDVHRALGSLVNMQQPVFVDNHLIILKPKSGKISDCRKALKVLKNTKTDEWINDQIRCRHLTVKVVSKIPL